MTIKEYIAYLKDNPKGYWFRGKLYGWGWTPANWKGWLVLALYLLALWGAYTCPYTRETTGTFDDFILFRYLPQVFVLTLLLLIICLLKGEKPRWRWGK